MMKILKAIDDFVFPPVSEDHDAVAAFDRECQWWNQTIISLYLLFWISIVVVMLVSFLIHSRGGR